MTEIKLSKAEAKILTEAAGEGGLIMFPASMKVTARERLVGRLVRDGLTVAGDGEEHRLTPAGYRAVGLAPPRAAIGIKKALVVELLRREEGASLAELVCATGWQPHTTRAVLCRLRAGEEELAKSRRPDGVTFYRIAAAASPVDATPPTAPTQRGRGGRRKADAAAVGAAA